jgi:NAD(P)H-dependent flavin oxidoreductase YrpB (nitropropane dioxygenase family)
MRDWSISRNKLGMWQTRITELLGIEIPIVGGAMQWLSRAPLVTAISNAGGLGILSSATFSSKEELRNEIRKTRELTDRPFAVNINLFPMIRPYSVEGMIDVCHEEGVRILETSGRSPEPYLKQLKEGNTIHMHKCARVRDAVKAEVLGADLVTIMGIEGGGHPSYEEVTTLVLLPRTVAAVRIPVLAGGGFADGRGLMAALALGAEGIVLGTRLLATEECPLHPAFKKVVVEADVNETTLLLRSARDHRRVFLNKVAQEVLEMEAQGAVLEEIFQKMAGQRIKEAYKMGDIQGGIFPCGQVVGLIKEVMPVQELFRKILQEAEEIRHYWSV